MNDEPATDTTCNFCHVIGRETRFLSPEVLGIYICGECERRRDATATEETCAVLAMLAQHVAPDDDALHDAVADVSEKLVTARRAIALLASLDAVTRESVRAHAEVALARALQERRSCGDYRGRDVCDHAELEEQAAKMLIAAIG